MYYLWTVQKKLVNRNNALQYIKALIFFIALIFTPDTKYAIQICPWEVGSMHPVHMFTLLSTIYCTLIDTTPNTQLYLRRVQCYTLLQALLQEWYLCGIAETGYSSMHYLHAANIYK